MNRLRHLPLRWIAAGVLSYGAFVVLTAPASLMTVVVYRSSNARAVLSDTQGTFWNGKGTLTIVGPQNVGVSLRTEWHFRPLSLFSGRLGLDVTGSGSGASLAGIVEAGPRSIAFRRFFAAVPAGWAALLDVPMLAGEPDGQVRLESKVFFLGRSGASGSALITWQNAGTANTGKLGSYRLSINGQGPRAALVLETISEGAMFAAGRGDWTLRTGDASFNGTLSPRGPTGALEPLLQFVGPDNGGQRVFSLAGRIPLPF